MKYFAAIISGVMSFSSFTMPHFVSDMLRLMLHDSRSKFSRKKQAEFSCTTTNLLSLFEIASQKENLVHRSDKRSVDRWQLFFKERNEKEMPKFIELMDSIECEIKLADVKILESQGGKLQMIVLPFKQLRGVVKSGNDLSTSSLQLQRPELPPLVMENHNPQSPSQKLLKQMSNLKQKSVIPKKQKKDHHQPSNLHKQPYR